MEKERNLIVEYGKKLITENLTDGTGGNISIYDPEKGLMAISHLLFQDKSGRRSNNES